MGVDVARGVAVLGMIAAHVAEVEEYFSFFSPNTWSGLVHGRPSILFALLAGVSLALMSGGRTIVGPGHVPLLRLKILGRGIAIFVVGLAMEALGTPIAVILTLYGALYVIALPFLRMSRKELLMWAAGIGALGPVTLAVWRTVVYGYGPGLGLVLQPQYSLAVWIPLMLVGLAIGRSDLRSWRFAAMLSAAGGAVAVLMMVLAPLFEIVTSGLSEYKGSTWGSSSAVDSSELASLGSFGDSWGIEEALVEGGRSALDGVLGTWPHSGSTVELVGSGAFAVVVLGLCLLVSPRLRVPLIPLAAIGSMPLTIYSAHLVWYALQSGVAEGCVP